MATRRVAAKTAADVTDVLEEETNAAKQQITKESNTVTDTYKVQANLKFADQLFNVRGNSSQEVAELLAEFAENAESIFDSFDKVKQVTLAKGLSTPQGLVPAPKTADGGTAELRCKHGPYTDLKGKKKKGTDNLYEFRYYCPAKFGTQDKCKPADLPGQERQ